MNGRPRTLADAERDYDRALVSGANAVACMQEKLKRQDTDAKLALAATVLSCGGRVEVSQRALLDAHDTVLTVEYNSVEHTVVMTAKVKPT